jgi:hypothetical protein
MNRYLWILGYVLVCTPFHANAQGYRPDLMCTPTAENARELNLGRRLSLRSLVLTEVSPNAPAFAMMGGRLLLSHRNNNNAYLTYNISTGNIDFGQAIRNQPGAPLYTDYLGTAQGDRPILVSETRGIGHVCAAALVGTCGVGTIVQGATQCLQATASSRTRYCTCTSDGAGTPVYAWALDWGAGAVGTATTCPEVTP